jgi:hypothetical protein
MIVAVRKSGVTCIGGDLSVRASSVHPEHLQNVGKILTDPKSDMHSNTQPWDSRGIPPKTSPSNCWGRVPASFGGTTL